MEISLHTKMLIYFLKKHNVKDKDRLLGMTLLLEENEELIEDLILWMERVNPTEIEIITKVLTITNHKK